MENIHIQFTKTYESKTKNRKTKESKLQFDLFDQALQENGKREAPKLRKYTIGRRITRSVSKKNSSSSSDVNTSGVNEESGEQQTKGKDQVSTKHTKKISQCGLFVNNPKKAKWTTHTRKKGTRKVSKRSNIYSCHRMSVKESVELLESTMMALKNTSCKRVSTPVLASPKYPSIEVFRDVRKQPLDWSLVHREAESSHVRTSLSLSDSFREGTEEAASITDKEQPEHSFSFRQPWAPTGVRQRSFVKIRTPAAVSHNASQSLQMEPVPGAVEDKGDDSNSSSYTSVYTWTTATGTVTNTAQMGSEVESRPKGDNPGSRSPILVLKSYLQENLHSTAIHPHHDICHLQQTPQVSPIKCMPGDEMRHRTPSAPTQNVSPRGPRKTHSFLSLPARSVPPKCSTMLFSSSMADSGDAPLDVSSIRMALSEATDMNEGANALTNHDPCRRVSIEPTENDNFHLVDNILTSTPCRGGSEKLMWNLSSVQALSEEDELCPLQTSGNVVNSQEIMAATLSDASMNTSGDQAMQWKGTRPEAILAAGPEREPMGNPESGVSPDSAPVNPVGNPETGISPDSPLLNPVGNPETGISPNSLMVNPVGKQESGISPDSPLVNPVGNPVNEIRPNSPPVNLVGNPQSGISPDRPLVNPVGNPESGISPDSPPVNPVDNTESGISPDSPPVNPAGNTESGISPESSPFTPIHFLRPDPTGPGYHGSPPIDFAATPAESPEPVATHSPQLGGLFTELLDFVYVQDQAFPGDGEVGGGDGLGGIGLVGSCLDGVGLGGIGLDGCGLDGVGLDGVGLDGSDLDGLCFNGNGLDGSGLDGGGLDGRGESCGKGSEVPDAGGEAKSKPGGGRSPRKAHQAPSGTEDAEMLCTSDSSYTYELSVDDRLYVYSPSQKKQVPEKRGLKKELLAERDDEVEDCPVSSLRYREGDTKRRPSRCPHLLLEVEPADSGFLDMVSTAPADIIGVVSEKFRPSIHSP